MGNIGENIKRYRENLGLSMNQLAKRIGKSRSAISQYENGEIMPRMGTIEDLARALGVSKMDIIEPQHSYYLVHMPESAPDALTDEERRLLEAFRSLDESARHAALYSVEGMAAAYRQAKNQADSVAAR